MCFASMIYEYHFRTVHHIGIESNSSRYQWSILSHDLNWGPIITWYQRGLYWWYWRKFWCPQSAIRWKCKNHQWEYDICQSTPIANESKKPWWAYYMTSQNILWNRCIDLINSHSHGHRWKNVCQWDTTANGTYTLIEYFTKQSYRSRNSRYYSRTSPTRSKTFIGTPNPTMVDTGGFGRNPCMISWYQACQKKERKNWWATLVRNISSKTQKRTPTDSSRPPFIHWSRIHQACWWIHQTLSDLFWWIWCVAYVLSRNTWNSSYLGTYWSIQTPYHQRCDDWLGQGKI